MVGRQRWRLKDNGVNFVKEEKFNGVNVEYLIALLHNSWVKQWEVGCLIRQMVSTSLGVREGLYDRLSP